MKRSLRTLILVAAALLLAAAPAAAQSGAVPGVFSKITLPLAQPPQMVPSGAAVVVGNPGPQTYYYWVVSDYVIGNSSPAGPFPVPNAPNILSATNYDQINWGTATGASSYDVLRTTTPTVPAGACNCAVETGVTGNSAEDQSNTLLSYTVSTLDSSTLSWTVTNLPKSNGVSQLEFSANGVQAWTVDSTGVQAFTGITAKTIGGVAYADQYAGADIGAKINAAISALPGGCGTVEIPSGNFADATTVVKPRCVIIAGQSGGMNGGGVGTPEGTVINWTPTTGVAIAVGDGDGSNAYPSGGIRDLTINGPSGSNTAVGLWLGGDPAGVVLPAGDYAEFQLFSDLRITGFGTGVEWGSNAWKDEFSHASIFLDTTGLTCASSLTNSAESNVFTASAIFNNTNPVSCIPDGSFIGTSFDYNTNPLVGGVQFIDDHFEAASGPFIEGSGPVTIIGGLATTTGTTGTDPFWFEATGTNAQWSIYGLSVYAGHAVTDLLHWASTGSSQSYFIGGLAGNGNGDVLAETDAGFINNTSVMLPATNMGSESLLAGELQTESESLGDNSPASSGNYNLILRDDANGSDAAPKKYLRVDGAAGDFQILNNAFSATILDLSDAGALSWAGGSPIPSSSDIELSGANGSSRGSITISSATTGSHSFATAYSAAPSCTASVAGTTPPATALSYAVSSTTSAVTITLSASGTATFNWSCGPAVN